jgi:hypothetical protein
MISQLFALPLRALIIAAVLPIPPAVGADLVSPPPTAAIGSALPDHSTPRAIGEASR